ncbi:hypothetical protein [Streptomyces sp. NPDC059349]|uniref:hypothetical protein n=1 Tax=Streptomyces sp. NPDC059349 TaxID=3346808 RepID=UPI0036BB4A72
MRAEQQLHRRPAGCARLEVEELGTVTAAERVTRAAAEAAAARTTFRIRTVGPVLRDVDAVDVAVVGLGAAVVGGGLEITVDDIVLADPGRGAPRVVDLQLAVLLTVIIRLWPWPVPRFS